MRCYLRIAYGSPGRGVGQPLFMRLANTQLFADYGPFGMMLMASPTLSEAGKLAVKGPSLGGALGLSAMSKPALVAPPPSVARPPLGEPGMFVVSEAPNKATVSPSETPAIRKCCNFENGDGGGPERNWAARFQADRSNNWSMNRFCWRTSLSLTHRACPFRIMCMASYPAIVRPAARKSRTLCLASTCPL